MKLIALLVSTLQRQLSLHDEQEKIILMKRLGILDIVQDELDGEISPTGVHHKALKKNVNYGFKDYNESGKKLIGEIPESQKDSENIDKFSNEHEENIKNKKGGISGVQLKTHLVKESKEELQDNEKKSLFNRKLKKENNNVPPSPKMTYTIIKVREAEKINPSNIPKPVDSRMLSVPFGSMSIPIQNNNDEQDSSTALRKCPTNYKDNIVIAGTTSPSTFFTGNQKPLGNIPSTRAHTFMNTSIPDQNGEETARAENKAMQERNLNAILEEKNDENEKGKIAHEEEALEIKYREKFILKLGDIATESSCDVLPRNNQTILNIAIPAITIMLLPPYKMKIQYRPTEWPVDIFEDIDNKAKKESDGGSIHDSASGIMSRNGQSFKKHKTTKKAPKGKRKKQKNTKAKGDNESQFSSRPGSVKEPSVFSSHTLKQNGDAKSQNTSQKIENENIEEKKEIKVFTMIQDLQKIREEDSTGKKLDANWSGQQVLQDCDPNLAVWLTDNLCAVHIWHHGFKGLYENIRYVARKFIISEIVENLMNLLVIINTIALAMDRYRQPDSEANALNTLNIAFTSIFTAEMVTKIFGMGLAKYLGDSLNCLDGFVVLLSWIEIIFLGGQGSFSAFRTLRVLRLVRTIRVMRVARLLRSFRSIHTLMKVMQTTIGSFGYIGMLLLIIMCIYALFGMQLFGGKWNFPDGNPRPNFDSFNNAFISIFQLLTVENWPVLLYSSLRNTFQPLVAFYYISFLFIGNYILLNLFLAIMLDAFGDEDGNDDEEETKTVKNYKKII